MFYVPEIEKEKHVFSDRSDRPSDRIQLDKPSPKFSAIVSAVILLGIGVYLGLALVSYDPLDPSWNVSLPGPIQNYMGESGAVVADIMRQLFGRACFLIPLFALLWGGLYGRGRSVSYVGVRFLGVMVLVLLIAGLDAVWMGARGVYPPPGGLVGGIVYDAVSSFPLGSVLFVIVISCCVILAVSSGLSWNDVMILCRFVSRFRLPVFGQPSSVSNQDLKVPTFQESNEQMVDKKSIFQPGPVDDSLSQKSLKKMNQMDLFAGKKHPSVEKNIEYHHYELPSLGFLGDEPSSTNVKISEAFLQEKSQQLMGVLDDFGIKGEINRVRPGPVVTLYEFLPAPGIKASRIIGLADDIARSMSAVSTRISVIPGHNAMGIELPNQVRQMVSLKPLLRAPDYESSATKLAIALGRDIGGESVIADLARMPHLLVAGTTGSGKSVAINTMILSILYRMPPERCRFIMIDPKMLELSVYDGIPHLLSPVVTDPKKAVYALKWAVKEMEDRYRCMSKLGVRNIEGYNARLAEASARGEELTRKIQTGFDSETGAPIYETQPLDKTPLPYIIVIVDEMADLMLVAGKEIESTVQRLAQMARAAGIHLIMATQRPSVDVITGTIKANFPTRISFQVTSRFDSRTILSEQGAEQLLGRGDMLYMEPGGKIVRVHGPFVSDQEVEHVVQFLKSQGAPSYVDTITEDSSDLPSASFGEPETDQLYQQALDLVRREKKASTSFIQRHLQIGYNRAARLIEQMESDGVVSSANHVGKREVLLSN